MNSKKSLADAYILGLAFGIFGAHHYYLGRRSFGIIYTCTFGLLGVGYLFDLLRMKWLVDDANKRGQKDTKRKLLSDCYILGLVGGWLGAHHFFIGNWRMGILYIFTGGIFGAGWLADLARMKWILETSVLEDRSKKVSTAYILWLPPLGVIGGHHFYLKNIKLGIMYYCTGGIFGIGWIVDFFRMKLLVHRSNINSTDRTLDMAYILLMSPLGIFGAHHFYLHRWTMGFYYLCTAGVFGLGWLIDIVRLPVIYKRWQEKSTLKYIDDAYLYWFPLGFLGFHQLYLQRPRWAVLYLFTGGCLGLGWFIDALRIPALVTKLRKNTPPEEQHQPSSGPICFCCSTDHSTEEMQSYAELNVLRECRSYCDLGRAPPNINSPVHQEEHYIEIEEKEGASAAAIRAPTDDPKDCDDGKHSDEEEYYLTCVDDSSKEKAVALAPVESNIKRRHPMTLPRKMTPPSKPTCSASQENIHSNTPKHCGLSRNISMSKKIQELSMRFS